MYLEPFYALLHSSLKHSFKCDFCPPTHHFTSCVIKIQVHPMQMSYSFRHVYEGCKIRLAKYQSLFVFFCTTTYTDNESVYVYIQWNIALTVGFFPRLTRESILVLFSDIWAMSCSSSWWIVQVLCLERNCNYGYQMSILLCSCSNCDIYIPWPARCFVSFYAHGPQWTHESLNHCKYTFILSTHISHPLTPYLN